MGSLERRLRKIEEQANSANATPVRSEEDRRQRWLWRRRDARRENTPKCVFHARSYLAWLRMVGKLPSFASAAELIEQILEAPDASGYRQPPETRSRGVIEREVYAAIRRRDEGLGHLTIPAEWDVALVASETLRDRFLSMPPEHFAKWRVESAAMQEQGEPKAALEEHARRYAEPNGISEELLTTAQGPNGAVLTDEERHWMVYAPLDDAMAEEWGWQIAEAIRRIEAEQAKQTPGDLRV
jgi:hypothetical protein